MTLTRLIIPVVMLSLGLCAPVVNAQYENLSPQQLLDELAQTLASAKEVEADLNESIVTKQRYAQEKAILDREKVEYDRDVAAYNAELSSFNAEVARYNAECDRQLSRAEFDECEAWADRLEPDERDFDEKLAELDARKEALNTKVAEWNQRDAARAAIAELLLSEYDDYDATTSLLLGMLNNLEIFKNSVPGCARSPSPEATHQCMQNILNR